MAVASNRPASATSGRPSLGATSARPDSGRPAAADPPGPPAAPRAPCATLPRRRRLDRASENSTNDGPIAEPGDRREGERPPRAGSVRAGRRDGHDRDERERHAEGLRRRQWLAKPEPHGERQAGAQDADERRHDAHHPRGEGDVQRRASRSPRRCRRACARPTCARGQRWPALAERGDQHQGQGDRVGADDHRQRGDPAAREAAREVGGRHRAARRAGPAQPARRSRAVPAAVSVTSGMGRPRRGAAGPRPWHAAVGGAEAPGLRGAAGAGSLPARERPSATAVPVEWNRGHTPPVAPHEVSLGAYRSASRRAGARIVIPSRPVVTRSSVRRSRRIRTTTSRAVPTASASSCWLTRATSRSLVALVRRKVQQVADEPLADVGEDVVRDLAHERHDPLAELRDQDPREPRRYPCRRAAGRSPGASERTSASVTAWMVPGHDVSVAEQGDEAHQVARPGRSGRSASGRRARSRRSGAGP